MPPTAIITVNTFLWLKLSLSHKFVLPVLNLKSNKIKKYKKKYHNMIIIIRDVNKLKKYSTKITLKVVQKVVFYTFMPLL